MFGSDNLSETLVFMFRVHAWFYETKVLFILINLGNLLLLNCSVESNLFTITRKSFDNFRTDELKV